jgi:V/A-type H+-transporting ATPase subunit I
VADLKLGSLILPRSDSPRAISRLTEFEWFHKIDTENDIVTPEIDDLLLDAQQVYQSIDDVVKGLGIPPMVGILEIMFKGTTIKKKDYEIDEIEGMVGDLKKRTPAIIDEPSKLLEEQATTKRSLEEYTSLKETLEIAKKLNIDLSGFGLMKYFYTNLFVINSADFEEISRALEGITFYKYELASKEKAAILVISSTSDSDKTLKILRGFNANPFVIPEGISQLTEKQKTNTKQIAKITKKIRRDILAIHEEAQVAKDVLETVRKPAGTKHFAVIQGFIPSKMEDKFKNSTKQWMLLK